MTLRWVSRTLLTAAFALALGCSGQPTKQFSPAAAPIALRMMDAINVSNSSTMAGHLERARELHANRMITDGDFKLLLQIHELASYNSWNDAKKVLQEALPQSGG